MYVIMAYDVAVERLDKVLQIGRRYLTWVQNSVLEGEISNSNLQRLKNQISETINKDHDTVTFYMLRTTKYSKKETIGVTKGEPTTII
nr:CRISPR-associated endonuclease Cas2 [Candidatus Freyarchaeota archaeon]